MLKKMLYGFWRTQTKIFKVFGWEHANGFERTTNYNRFAVITSKTTNTEIIRKTFNSNENWDGKLIRVIIGSESASEALSFHHMTHVFLFTPMWNNSKTEQAIYRAIRVGSHETLIKRRKENNDERKVEVKVYRLATVTNDNEPTIDVEMYKTSEEKDYDIMRIQRILKTNSLDCELTKGRNLLPTDINGSRKCNYTDCNYECEGSKVNKTNYSTYTLYYSDKTRSDIKNYINDQLKRYSYLYIQDIYDMYPEMTNLVNLLLSEINLNYIPFNINGLNFHLVIKDGIIMLNPIFDNIVSESGYFYTRNPILSYGYNMDQLIELQRLEKDSQLICNKQEFTQISSDTLLLLLPILYNNKNKRSELGAKMYNHYIEQNVIDPIKKTYTINDVIYYFEKDSRPDLSTKDSRPKVSQKITVPDNMKSGIIGYIDENDNLRIMDFNKNKNPSGRLCNNLTAIELINYLYKSGAKQPIKVDITDKDELISNIKRKSGMGRIDTHLEVKELQYILSFSDYKKTSKNVQDDTLCSVLRKTLYDKKRLL